PAGIGASRRRVMARTSTPRSTNSRATPAPRRLDAPITSTVTAAVSRTSVQVVRLPHPGPGIGHELSTEQELACALRILARGAWRANLDGHISWATSDGGMWMSPWGIWWDEVKASDIIRLDADGNVVDGKWDVTGAVNIHTELHRTRPDATIIVH